MYKTQVMKTRIQDINPQAEVFPFETFVLPDNLEALFEQIPYKVDYIADAIDTVTAKLALVQYAIEHDIPIISSMGTGNKLHPELFEITDLSKTSVCPLCKVMRRELKKRGITSLKVLYSKGGAAKAAGRQRGGHLEARRTGQCLLRSPVAGLLIAGEVIRGLTGRN